VRIACAQIAPDVERPADNPGRVRAAIRDALAGGAELIVVPELSNSGYIFRSLDEARAAAVPADGELLTGWAEELAAAGTGALVVGGFCELAPDRRLFNSSALVGADGVLAVYRKLHLWDEESLWFTPGEDPAPVIDTPLGRIGLGVCYDLEFPELSRGLALAGAEVIALPTNWPLEAEPPNGRPIVHSLAAVTAYFSKVFVALCDRCGTERGVRFEGGSVIAGPDGALLAGPLPDHGPGMLLAECDLKRTRDKRTSARNDAFADRRPDQYAEALRESGRSYV
jgi:5-aminopentanamidase